MKMRFLGVATLVGIMLIGMFGTAFASPVEWYLDGAPGAGTEGSPYDMEHFTSGKSQSMSVNLNTDGSNGDVVYWRSDFRRTDGQTTNFPDYDWNVILRLNMQPDPGDITVDIGYWDGSFHSFGMTDNTCSWSSPQATYNFNYPTDIDVLSGQYICVKVENTSTVDADDFVITSRSTVQYTDVETPFWPAPEIATIIMISIGVLTLGGYIWYRRRQAAPVAA